MTLRKSIILYGAAMAALIGILKFIEYRFYVRDLSMELYIGLVAALFIILGIWVGRRLTRVKIISPPPEFVLDDAMLKRLGITKREYEVLDLIAGIGRDFIDLSTEVIPRFLGRIATYQNTGYHRDIGTPESLRQAEFEFNVGHA